MRFVKRFVIYCGLAAIVLVVAYALGSYAYNSTQQYQSRIVAWPEGASVKPIEWSVDRPGELRILAIQGGGMYGVIYLEILKYFEEKSGRPIADLFDYVAGSSTGAIIATSLLLPDEKGKPLHSVSEVSEDYIRLGKQILDAPFYHTVLTLGGIFGPRFTNHRRISIFGELYGTVQFGELLRPVMVPTFSRENFNFNVFRNWHEKESGMYISAIVSAATAVPSVFPAIELAGDGDSAGLHTDAMFFLNDPAELAFLQALERFPEADFTVVTLGSLRGDDISQQGSVHGGLLDWLGPFLSMVFVAQSDVAQSALDRHAEIDTRFKVESFRFAPEVPLTTGGLNASDANIDQLKKIAQDYIEENKAELDKALALLTNEDRTD